MAISETMTVTFWAATTHAVALDSGDDPELEGLAHETLAAPGSLTFDAAQHLVSAAAGERDSADSSGPRVKRGLRDRVARLLDIVSGPTA